MPDLEKVIRIIDELIYEAQKEPTWKAENALRCVKKELLKEQETELEQKLKEQEAKEVIESTNMHTGLPITHCTKCGVSIDRYLYGRQYEGQINYCPFCGQKVKWNDGCSF